MMRQAQSFSLVRFLHFKEIKINASSSILIDLRLHFSASFVTVSKHEKILGMSDVSSNLAFNDRRCQLWPSILSTGGIPEPTASGHRRLTTGKCRLGIHLAGSTCSHSR
ncbi:hypothetical protein Fot_01494 [Forsythia ovata]|uniref:Uncharacterized protein n=1 Tax=Forsythia ovata TaxID=205694 RepID=A0ABD1X462_9LAMI